MAYYTSNSAQNVGNYSEIMLAPLNYASYHQNYATWFLSKIKTEQGELRQNKEQTLI